MIGLALALTALSGCAGPLAETAAAPVAEKTTALGPLEFPDGFGLVMAPRSGSSYAVFEACGARGDLKTRLIRVGPVRLTGADAVRFEAAWPVPEQPPLPGGGGLPLPEPYERSAGSAGMVRGCANPPASLEIAAVLPPAVTADIVVDGVEVVYEVAGHRYSDIADVMLGICATEVEGRRSEHCR